MVSSSPEIPSTTSTIEICNITPPPSSPAAHFALPLTLFDTFWLKASPVERTFFYRFPSPAAAATSSSDVIIPRLKHSLSLTLRHFVPLAGKLIWPENAEVPFLLYTPPNDGVSFTIAESTDEHSFDQDGPLDASLSRAYVPKLDASRSNAAVFALQSTVMFMKAWAHVSKELGNGADDGGELTEELTPFLDRTVVNDPDGIALRDAMTWMANNESYPRCLELLPESVSIGTVPNQVRRTFQLSRQDINKLKKSIEHQLESNHNNDSQPTEPISLSTFVVIYAYTLVCFAKAAGFDDDKSLVFTFIADCRSRSDPPLPCNYFGNCIMPFASPVMKFGDLVHEGGVPCVARTIIKVIKEFDEDVLVGAKGRLERYLNFRLSTKKQELPIWVGVAGSPRFGVYEIDFGFGRPEKVEITSIDRSPAISMSESGDGSGGVEVGVVMLRHEMEKFASAFFNGLN
ncbi:Malonyl-CoA:anthocyanidin 5-O-glucoside-6''-O-malonyltransferase [Linum grandiflorum]